MRTPEKLPVLVYINPFKKGIDLPTEGSGEADTLLNREPFVG
jgi:hypothetical protein